MILTVLIQVMLTTIENALIPSPKEGSDLGD